MSIYSPIRVIIADDHHLIRDGLQDNFKGNPEFNIIAEAKNGEQLLQLTRQLKPDVVVTDIKMPGMDGIEVTRRIKEELPYIGVIALTSYDEENLVIDILRAGAKGFLLKTAGKHEIFQAVRKVHKDEQFYCSFTTERIAEIISRRNYNPIKRAAREFFSERELQVIQLVCQGLSSKQIGDQLGLKPRTIDSYREHIMQKMQVNNSAAVVMYAVEHGLYTKKN